LRYVYASKLRADVVPLELLGSRLCKSWLIELEDEELAEFEPKFSLSCCRTVAPEELGAMEASSDMALLTAELSPAARA
jgi:hypothetical protein